MSLRRTTIFASSILSAACGSSQGTTVSSPSSTSATTPPAPMHHGRHSTGHPASADADAKLAEVARVHGGAGPWAVAGYRMGAHALGVLGVERGSFDLEIVHYTPKEVQYSCIAD